jgi:hypothetical protein
MENSISNELAYSSQKANNIWLFFLLFGWSYGAFNQMGKQIFFWITFGGCGFWWFYLLFTLSNKIKQHNRQVALRCGFTQEQMLKYDLI